MSFPSRTTKPVRGISIRAYNQSTACHTMDEKPPNSVNKVLVLKRIKRFKIYPEENKEFEKSKKGKACQFSKTM